MRREEILQAVIDVCSAEGIGKLSVSNVTSRVGCARSLFYHYFPSKEVALESALDYTIDASSHASAAGTKDAPSAISKRPRRHLPSAQDARPRNARYLGSITEGGDAVLYTTFVNRVAERCARYICESTVVDFARYHEVLIDNVYETFYVLISGLILYIRSHKDVPEPVIKDIIACTLHIEAIPRSTRAAGPSTSMPLPPSPIAAGARAYPSAGGANVNRHPAGYRSAP